MDIQRAIQTLNAEYAAPSLELQSGSQPLGVRDPTQALHIRDHASKLDMEVATAILNMQDPSRGQPTKFDMQHSVPPLSMLHPTQTLDMLNATRMLNAQNAGMPLSIPDNHLLLQMTAPSTVSRVATMNMHATNSSTSVTQSSSPMKSYNASDAPAKLDMFKAIRTAYQEAPAKSDVQSYSQSRSSTSSVHGMESKLDRHVYTSASALITNTSTAVQSLSMLAYPSTKPPIPSMRELYMHSTPPARQIPSSIPETYANQNIMAAHQNAAAALNISETSLMAAASCSVANTTTASNNMQIISPVRVASVSHNASHANVTASPGMTAAVSEMMDTSPALSTSSTHTTPSSLHPATVLSTPLESQPSTPIRGLGLSSLAAAAAAAAAAATSAPMVTATSAITAIPRTTPDASPSALSTPVKVVHMPQEMLPTVTTPISTPNKMLPSGIEDVSPSASTPTSTPPKPLITDSTLPKLELPTPQLSSGSSPATGQILAVASKEEPDSPGKLRCPECFDTVPDINVLKEHLKEHGVDKLFPCQICAKPFSKSSDLARHVRIHTGERPYKCVVCDRQFTESGHLTTHMRTHTGEKPFHCEICFKQFVRSGDLNRHMRTHTGEKPYPCKICSKSFSESGHLTTHTRTHTGERPFRCKVCAKLFVKSGDLTRHMRTHTGEKPYKCQICGKHFSESGHLTTHIRTHTGEKPYECERCKKLFVKSGDLVRHTRVHTGERPFACKLCSKRFKESGHLTSHMRTHSGERPFSCQICFKQFVKSGDVTRHMKVHNSVKNNVPEK